MSLMILAARICLFKALKGRTSVGNRVFDSYLQPMDLMENGGEGPVIVTFCDTGRMDVANFEFLSCDHHADFFIETFIAQPVSVKTSSGETESSYAIAQADDAYENYLRILGWEIFRTLADPDNVWAELLRRCFSRANPGAQAEWDRGGRAEKGYRFAVIRYMLKMEVLYEPLPGQSLEPEDGQTSFWHDFLAAMEEDGEYSELAGFLRGLLSKNAPIPSWKAAIMAAGLTKESADVLGMSVYSDQPASEITVEWEDLGATTVVTEEAP